MSLPASTSDPREELNSLRAAVGEASRARRKLESHSAAQAEAVTRLQAANDALSAKTLNLADEAERSSTGAKRRLQEEIESLKQQVIDSQEEADEVRTRGQAQRIQLLDELNSLQAEVADLRKQLRAAQRGGTPGR